MDEKDEEDRLLEATANQPLEDEGQLLRFLNLYNAHYRQMYVFARTLLPHGNDVDDIMQEASLTLWRKFSTFQPNTNFSAWAYKVIRIEVLRLFQQKKRERYLFDEEFIDIVATKFLSESNDSIQDRYNALLECVKGLSSRMQELISDRYFRNRSVAEIAATNGLSEDTVYQQLSRVRKTLRTCVLKKTK